MAITFQAGSILTATNLNALIPVLVTKANNQSVVNSIAMVNDNDLAIAIPANSTWEIQSFIQASGAAAGDIRIAWGLTGTVALGSPRKCVGPTATTTDATATSVRNNALATATQASYGTDGTNASVIEESFTVVGGASGGTLILQWSQNAVSATATIVQAGSFLVATRLG